MLRVTGARRNGPGTSGSRPLPTLARNGGLAFFLATLVYNGGNFVFHMAMSRMLGPAGYGALGSLLGLVTIAVLPISALQAAVTQSVAERRARREPERAATGGAPDPAVTAPTTVTRPFLWTCAAAAGVLALLGALAPVVDRFLSLSSPVPLLLLGTYVATSVATIVPQGLLIGQLRFRPVAISLVVGSVVRLVGGVALVGAGLGLDAAAAASALSGIASLVVLLWALRAELAGHRPSVAPGAPRDGITLRLGPAMLAVVALAGVSAFLGVDSLLARHYLSRVDAGYYVAAATAARVALFLPGAVAMTVFPRLAAAQGEHRELRRLLVDALAVTVVLSGGAAAVIAAFPHLVIAVLFGHAYQHASGPLAILSAAAAAMGVASVLVYFFLARTSVLATACWAAVAAVAVLIVLAHRGLDTIAWLTLAVTTAMALAMAVVALGQPHPARRRHGLRAAAGAGSADEPGDDRERDGVDVTVVARCTAPDHLPPAVPELAAALRAAGATLDIVAVSTGAPATASTGAPLTASTGAPATASTGAPVTASTGIRAGGGGGRRGEPSGTAHGDEPAVRWLPAGVGAGTADLLRAALSSGNGRYVAFVGTEAGLAPEDVVAAVTPGRHRAPDIVLGTRRRGVHATSRRLSWWLRHVTARSLFRVPVRDTTACLALARRAVLLEVLPRLAGPDDAFDVEVLVVSHRLGYRRVAEAALGHQQGAPEPVSHRTALASLRALIGIFYRLRVLHYYDGDEMRVDGIHRAAHLAVEEAIG